MDNLEKMKNREILIKWKSYGFLEEMEPENQIKLAMAYEYLANKLIIEAKPIIRYHDNIEVLVFPILRRYYGLNPSIELSNDFLDDFIKQLNLYITSDFYCQGMDNLNNLMGTSVDIEVILLKIFCEDIYENKEI